MYVERFNLVQSAAELIPAESSPMDVKRQWLDDNYIRGPVGGFLFFSSPMCLCGLLAKVLQSRLFSGYRYPKRGWWCR